ncbi:MAG: TRAP transporter substrate-binding protein [Mailhella sp.]|nr:TRAP transporter substrate-binding protein [Mailhella sp.]
MKILATALLGCFVFAGAAPVQQTFAAEKIIVRLSHSNTPSDMDPYHAIVVKLKNKVETALGKDRIEIQEFPAGQLGSEDRAFQDVQQGVIQMCILAVNNASVFAPSLGAFDMPYIFKNVEEFDKCVDENWDLINKNMEQECGNVALVWHSQGYRFITNSKQPITKIGDLANVKIRTPNNPIMIETYRSWGTEPVPLAWDETFNAVQQKVVDGQDNPLVSIATNRFYEIQTYVSEPHYKLWTGPLVVNAEWLSSLPQDVRDVLIKAGREVTVEMRDLLTKQENMSREFLKEKKMVFCGVPVDEDEWMKRAMSTWPKFYPQLKNMSTLEAFMKTLGRELPR